MASDAEVDLVINATRALPELERDLSRIITTAQNNADDVDVNAVLATQGSITRITTQLNQVVTRAQNGADDIDVTAVLNQLQSLNAIRSTLDDVVTQAQSGAPDIDVDAVLARANSIRNIRQGLDDVVRTAQAAAPDIQLRTDIDTDEPNRGLRNLITTFRGAASTAVSTGASFARVGASAGAMGAAVGAAVPLVAGLVAEIANIVPAAGVAASAFLTLKLASGTLKVALIGVEEAISSVFDPDADPEELAKALERLAPEARKFVQELQKMRGPLREIQQRVQNRFFEGFDDSLRELSKAVLPSVRTALDDTAGSLNRMARGAASAATNLGDRGILGSALRSSTKSLENLERIPAQIVDGFGKIAAAAGPSLERITDAVAEKADDISSALDRAFESGRLQDAIEDAIDSIRQLGRIGGNVLGGLRNIFGGLTSDGNFLFDRLEQITQAFEDLTGTDEAQAFFGAVSTAVGKLSEALSPVLDLAGRLAVEVLPILTRVLEFAAELFERLAPVVEEVADTLGDALEPILRGIGSALDLILPKFLELVDKIMPKLEEAWTEIRPLVEELGVELGELAEVLGPLIVKVLELAFAILEDLLPIVGPIIQGALMALIGIVKLLQEGIEFLTPVVENIARVFRGDFDGALRGSLRLTDQVADTIGRLFVEMKDRVLQTIKDLANQQLTAFRDMFFRVTTAVGEFLIRLGDAFSKVPEVVRDAVGNLSLTLVSAGADLIRGLINGMQSQLGRLRDLASEIAEVVSGTVKNILKIQSPSREFFDIGDDTIQGFINGLRAAAPGLEDEMRRITAEFQASSPQGDDQSGIRFSVPAQAVPDVNVYVGGEPLDRRIVTVSTSVVQRRERTISQGVRT